MSKSTVIHVFALTAIASSVFFTNLGTARFWDRDEPRNAGCAAEMMQRGDLIVPIFNDELRHHKPVLTYWLMVSAYYLFGIGEFAARFWSALLGIGSGLLTYGIARRLFDPSVALLSGIALCSSIMFCVAARAATPDSTLIFFSTLGMYFYVAGTFGRYDPESGSQLKHTGHWFPQDTLFVVLMNVAFGFAVLTKGPIGFIVPTAIIGMFLLIQRLAPIDDTGPVPPSRIWCWLSSFFRTINPIHFVRTVWYMRPVTALAVVLFIAAPWYIAVGIETNGEFNRLFFLNENIARATTVMENHGGSWFYYPVTIALGFYPWSVFLGPIIVASFQQIRQRTVDRCAVIFLACWVLVQIGLFTIAETKLPSYVTPCYPALSILTAVCILKWLPSMGTTGIKWQYATMGTYIVSGVLASAGLAVASSQFFPQISWIALLGLIPIVGGILAIYFYYNQRQQSAILATAGSSILFCFFMFAVGTVAVDSTRQTQVVLDEIKSAIGDQSVASYHCMESSWVVYSEKPIFELHRGSKNVHTPTTLDRTSFWQKKPVIAPEDFVRAEPNAMIITTDEYANELLARLPGDFEIASRTEFFLKKNRKLVLIRRGHDENNETASSNRAVKHSLH